MTTSDDMAQEQESIAQALDALNANQAVRQELIADALDVLNAISTVGDEPERAAAAGPEAVRHVVMAWATRALAAERALGAAQAAAAALRAEVGAVREEPGGPYLPLVDAVRRYAGVRPTPYGVAHPTPDGRPSEHDSPTARFMSAIAGAARAVGVAIEGAYATEEDALGLLWQIVATARPDIAPAATPARWARVELMGRTEAVGLLDEVEACGRRVLRLRELRRDGALEETYLMPGAVYRWRYVPEAEARRAALPRWAMACGAYEDAGACPGRCRTCGRPREDHEAARAAREEKAAGAGGEGEGGDDDAPDSIPF